LIVAILSLLCAASSAAQTGFGGGPGWFSTACGFHVGNNGRCGAPVMREGKAPVVCERVPRVAKLMALAIRFDGLIRDRVVKDQAELAKLGHVTRARLTQIMAFLNLAPDIQEAILTLGTTESGRDSVTERDLRPIAAELDWGKQREIWARVERG